MSENQVASRPAQRRPMADNLGLERRLGSGLARGKNELRIGFGRCQPAHYLPPMIWTCAAEPGASTNSSRTSPAASALVATVIVCSAAVRSSVAHLRRCQWPIVEPEPLDRTGHEQIGFAGFSHVYLTVRHAPRVAIAMKSDRRNRANRQIARDLAVDAHPVVVARLADRGCGIIGVEQATASAAGDKACQRRVPGPG